MRPLGAQTIGSAPPAHAALLRSFFLLAVGLGLALSLNFWVEPLIGPFRSKVLLDIGVNVVLAVSLTLVNGFTGQFSIGHAGFMALGGYAAAAITYTRFVAAYYVGLAISGSLFTWMLVRIIHYISVSGWTVG